MSISGYFHVLSMRRTRKYISCVAIENMSHKCAKLHTVAEGNSIDHPKRSLYYCLFASHIFVCCSLRTPCLWWITVSMQRRLRGCHKIPSFLQWTAPVARSFCEGCTWHHLHSLVKAVSTTLLWLERLSSKCAKLLTMAASNNRDATLCWFYFSLFASHIHGCCSSRTSRLWWIAHFNTTLTESLQHLKQGWA